MNPVLRGLTWNIVLAFLDDILVMGKSINEHLQNLKIVFNRFRQYTLKLKPAKCLMFLGRKVNKTEIAFGDEYVEVVKQWKTPKTTKEVEKFLEFTNYHRSFIKDKAKIAGPLNQLTGNTI